MPGLACQVSDVDNRS